ncbi:DUF2732 domain-containing protein [Salmonella enterica]|uniref:DUF2732 domain-containing protein n=4 Tax=Salmonella enterica I TaxID=59201 RepID=A0A5W3B0T4_SALHA|nr:DUF2732 family protein [Salmonella enterica]EAA9136721.1 DUF2732 domain-containing protein [Salmonella enterica subsp. enterica serovar Mbandaka]EAM2365380.1 DUF2732 domain-containing protein [Salmonella enterica subsp. enterica serovar 4,[5],12:i:-]EBO1973450.1 DUF2732 domain-containing protein [Salmonella enterica subsp. enterica serovar Muenchen]EBT0647531.1 DUF2732 domain-containing protein [Salmonella enterica subsp. enterica serovar Uganda]EBV1614257.1 DUF2732 domain-containing protei
MSRVVYFSTPRNAGKNTLDELFEEAKKEERKDRALAVSIRLEALAIHITKEGMSGTEAAELLRREAIRFENESQELH